MATLNYGIIGTGMMGQEHIRNVQLLPDTRILVAVEPDAGMRAEAAALVPDLQFADSISELLSIDALDCLIIASPNYLHAAQLKEIAAQRTLPILVEKPLVTSPEDASLVGELAGSHRAPIWVAMEYRYMPPMQEFLRRVDSATGGVTMLTIREHRFPFLQKVGDWNRFNRLSGGTLVEKCCHFFDLMRLVMGSEPVRVMASGGQTTNHLDESYGGQSPDIWDSAYALVDFANGKRAMLELCMYAEGSTYQEEITAVGPTGKIECLIPGPTRFWPDHLGAPPDPKVIVSPRHPRGPTEIEVPVDPALLEAGDHNGSTFYQHQKFRDIVLGGGTPEVTLHDGWKAVEMGMAAQRASDEGVVVTLA